MRLKKIIKAAAGWIGKKIHPAGLPETSLYFVFALGFPCFVNNLFVLL